jgi:hypothetical protein
MNCTLMKSNFGWAVTLATFYGFGMVMTAFVVPQALIRLQNFRCIAGWPLGAPLDEGACEQQAIQPPALAGRVWRNTLRVRLGRRGKRTGGLSRPCR